MSRDVIGHVTIRLSVPLFPLVLHCDHPSIFNSFRDISLQIACPVEIVIADARYHVTCTVPLCKILVRIWISHPHIAYSLWHFYWALMKNKGWGIYSWDPQCYTRNRAKIFPGKFWRFWWSVGQVFQKVAIFTPKGTSLREPTSLSHFASKSVEWCDLQVGWGKKVTETPIGKTRRR